MIHYILKRSLKLPMEEIAVVSCSSLPKSLLCYPSLSLRITKTGDHDLPNYLRTWMLSLNLRPTALAICCVPYCSLGLFLPEPKLIFPGLSSHRRDILYCNPLACSDQHNCLTPYLPKIKLPCLTHFLQSVHCQCTGSVEFPGSQVWLVWLKQMFISSPWLICFYSSMVTSRPRHYQLSDPWALCNPSDHSEFLQPLSCYANHNLEVIRGAIFYLMSIPSQVLSMVDIALRFAHFLISRD